VMVLFFSTVNMEDEFLYELYEPSELMKPLPDEDKWLAMSSVESYQNRRIVAVIERSGPHTPIVIDNYGQCHIGGWARLDLSLRYPLLESQRSYMENIIQDYIKCGGCNFGYQTGYKSFDCGNLSKYAQEFGKNRLKYIVSENKKLKEELEKLRLASLPPPKKPIGEEIAELQTRIMKLYAERDKN